MEFYPVRICTPGPNSSSTTMLYYKVCFPSVESLKFSSNKHSKCVDIVIIFNLRSPKTSLFIFKLVGKYFI